jgi:hypothetical protein
MAQTTIKAVIPGEQSKTLQPVGSEFKAVSDI